MKVRNRSASVVGYKIPDLMVRRRFAPGEIKDIPAEELKQLMFQPGGKQIMIEYLQVSKEDIVNLELDEQEKEYFLTDEEIKHLISSGSLDEFLDTLDFAPEGVINLIKKYALSMPMSDLLKIKALKEKTGFDVTKALEHSTDSEKELTAEPIKKRRVEEKYKVINN